MWYFPCLQVVAPALASDRSGMGVQLFTNLAQQLLDAGPHPYLVLEVRKTSITFASRHNNMMLSASVLHQLSSHRQCLGAVSECESTS